MSAFLKILLKNIGAAFLTKKMSIWGLRLIAKYTTNKVDDNVIDFVEAAANNDSEGMQVALEKLVILAKAKYQ